jgi:hypothetical protein
LERAIVNEAMRVIFFLTSIDNPKRYAFAAQLLCALLERREVVDKVIMEKSREVVSFFDSLKTHKYQLLLSRFLYALHTYVPQDTVDGG